MICASSAKYLDSMLQNLRHSKHLRNFLKVFIGIVAIEIIVCVGLMVAVYTYGRQDQAQTADVIIVLGAGLRRDGQAGPSLRRRAIAAADLWHQGIATNVICTGGYTENRPRSEADACREVLVSLNVPETVIWLEDRSRSTEENALYSKELMDAHQWQDAVVVSDGFHLLRAHWIFSDMGIPNFPSPAVDPPRMTHFFSTMREVAALHWFAFKRIFNLPYTYVTIL